MAQRKSAVMVALYALANQPFSASVAETEKDEWLCKAADSEEGGWACERRTPPNAAAIQSRYTSISAPISANARPPSRLDWVPLAELTEAQKASLPAGCCGAYIEPTRTDQDAERPPKTSSLRASANSSQLRENVEAIMSGDVLFTKGRQSVEADEVSFNNNTKIAAIKGNVSLREPGLLMLADSASINVEDGSGELENAEFVIHRSRARGSAERLWHNGEEVLTLQNGAYTQCEPETNTWLLKGGEIVIDANTDMASAKNVVLEVKGVPILYSPYISFPIGQERTSGLLLPTVGYGEDSGFDISQPYYFNLAENYDATVTPRLISSRGMSLETELRHLSPRFQTQTSLAYLGDDDGGNARDRQLLFEAGLISQDEVKPYKGEERWLLNLDQKGKLSPNWHTRINFAQVSDVDYFRDFGATSLDINSRTHLKRVLQTSYRSENWTYRLKTEDHRSLIENRQRPYRLLPQFTANANYSFDDIQLSLKNEITRFDHADELTNNNNPETGSPLITGERARLDYRLSWEKQWLWGHFKPALMAQSLSYKLDSRGLDASDNNSPSVFAPQASLDMGLVFERQSALFGGSTQTFEPRAFYFYSEYDDHSEMFNLGADNQFIDFDTAALTFSYNQLFRDTRFSGNDRIDDANQLATGLTTRYINNQTGSERFRASLGQVHYFEDRQVTLNGDIEDRSRSAMALQVSGQINDNWRLGSDLLYTEETQSLAKGSLSARYLDDKYRIFNFNYRYTRKDPIADSTDFDNDGIKNEFIDAHIEQVDISTLWPLWEFEGGSLSVIARYNYDFTYKRELETLAGLEYNSCCFQIRLAARRWLDNDLINSNPAFALDLKYDQGIFFEIELIGLGSSGGSIEKTLNEGIPGYQARARQLY